MVFFGVILLIILIKLTVSLLLLLILFIVSEADKIAEMMEDINIDPNNVQYLFDTDRLKSQTGTKLINISAILIEIPIGQKMININTFSIYVD